MNKLGAAPTLTNILIATLIGVFTLITLFTAYTGFLTDNGVNISEQTTGYYADLNEQSVALNEFSDEATLESTANAIWTGAANIFVVGVGAITKFFQMIPLLGTLLSIIESAIPGFTALFGMLAVIITVYITFQIIASKKGTTVKI